MIKPTTDADLRGFLKAISSPTVWPFISKEKLVKSEQFARLIESFDEHFSSHRDTGQFERVLAMLDGSKYRDVLAEYLRARHGVQVSREDKKIKITLLKTKSMVIANQEINFAQFLAMPRSERLSIEHLHLRRTMSMRWTILLDSQVVSGTGHANKS
jgi:hypothetical protein